MAGSGMYHLRAHIRGELSAAWWPAVFEGLDVEAQKDGTTLVSGRLEDEAALHGVLAAIRDLGLSLISIETVAISESSTKGAE